jgi:hypothetical protein
MHRQGSEAAKKTKDGDGPGVESALDKMVESEVHLTINQPVTK